MNFKYSIVLQWSAEDGGYIALVPELPGLSAFGASPEEAVKEARVAAELHLEEYAEEGHPPPPPELLVTASGQLRLRMPKSLHRNLAQRAARDSTSLNSFIVDCLTSSVAQRELAAQIRFALGGDSGAQRLGNLTATPLVGSRVGQYSTRSDAADVQASVTIH